MAPTPFSKSPRKKKSLRAPAVIPTDVDKATIHVALDAARSNRPIGTARQRRARRRYPYIAAQAVSNRSSALEARGAQVVAGRAYDPACFAALPIMKGYDEGLALHGGKIPNAPRLPPRRAWAQLREGILREDSFVLRHFPTTGTTADRGCRAQSREVRPLPPARTAASFDLTDRTTDPATARPKCAARSYVYTTAQGQPEGSAPVGYRTISIAGTRDLIRSRRRSDHRGGQGTRPC